MLLSHSVNDNSVKKFGHSNSESNLLSSFENVSKCTERILFYLPEIIVFPFAQIDSECQFFALPTHTLPRGKAS